MSKDKKSKIDKLLTRGIESIYPSSEALKTKLLGNKKLTVYMGIDPTGPSIHIGHASVLLKLREFADLGHEVIVLIGDFTAMIGDPDKLNVRKKLSAEEVKSNYLNYKKQIKKIFGPRPFKVVYNSKWFSKMTMTEVLDLTSEFTVAQMMERDMFVERVKKNKPIYVSEFLYPLMQGYDSVHLNCDVEIGGNDQTFNMLVGRQLMGRKLKKEKFVLTLKLLVDPTGKKMGKTEGNMVNFSDTPSDVYGQVMSWPDDLIKPGFEICLDITNKEVDKYLAQDPKSAKMSLAKLITEQTSSTEEAQRAEDDFVSKFQKKEEPLEKIILKVKKGEKLSEVLVRDGYLKSGSEFKRLVVAGGIIVDDNKLDDIHYFLNKNINLKVGKKRFFTIKVG